jgi:hypothetical protein
MQSGLKNIAVYYMIFGSKSKKKILLIYKPKENKNFLKILFSAYNIPKIPHNPLEYESIFRNFLLSLTARTFCGIRGHREANHHEHRQDKHISSRISDRHCNA